MLLAGALLLLALSAYCVLAILAARQYVRSRIAARPTTEIGISILKPLAGLDEGIEENLRSYFAQAYRNFELVFAVRDADAPVVAMLNRLMAEFEAVPARILLTGDPPYPHVKVFKLHKLVESARYDLLAMSDSDVRVGPDFCAAIAADFAGRPFDVATCPYRAVAGKSFWSRLEALGMNTDFFAGVFTAVMLEGMKFAVGPTIVATRAGLNAIGGIERVKDFIAEDFSLGQIAAETGLKVRLSSYVIEHRIGSEAWRANFRHRLRWARTSRRSRPAGYIGQFFTYPLPIALIVTALVPKLWPFVLVTLALRAVAALLVARALNARMNWLLLPLQDVLAFLFWIGGFFGNTVEWRGRTYRLNRDGTVSALQATKKP